MQDAVFENGKGWKIAKPEVEEAIRIRHELENDGKMKSQEVIEAYKQAILINPDDADAHFLLGGAYLVVGDKNAALNEYKILKDLNQDMAKNLFDLIYK